MQGPRLFLSVMALILVAGCGGGETPAPASLPRDEAQALNDAAAMLNSRDAAPPQPQNRDAK